MTKTPRLFLLGLVLIVIVGSITYLEAKKPKTAQTQTTSSGVTTVGSPYQEFQNPSGFVNTEPFALSEYIGKKVILVDFWTYTCINCQRTTPYLNAWWEEYEDDGLLIVGIHSPEFEFEKVLANVQNAVTEEGIEYPVVLDNDKSTWNAYGNRYWPRKYLIDLNGNVVYDLIGEGNYEETEAKIREVLGVTGDMSSPENTVGVDFTQVTSPETYFGSSRADNLVFTSIEPLSLSADTAYLVGEWEQEEESASNFMGQASILYTYTSKNVYLVASAVSFTNVNSVDLEIWLDGKYLKTISIGDETLYPLIEGTDYGTHTLKLIPKGPGIELFAFTFG